MRQLVGTTLGVLRHLVGTTLAPAERGHLCGSPGVGVVDAELPSLRPRPGDIVSNWFGYTEFGGETGNPLLSRHQR